MFKIHQMPSDFVQLDAPSANSCGSCGTSERLSFQFDYAYQPIVNVATRSTYAHEALVRGPAGEGAQSVLSQVTEHNRYRFDQACRVKAIKTAARLGMKDKLSINFLPNAVYKPEVCIRTTLEADFTPDFIKLDMALVRGVEASKSRQAISRGVLRICQEMRIQVIAEGVETADERDFFLHEGVTPQPLFSSDPRILAQALGARCDRVAWSFDIGHARPGPFARACRTG